MNVREGKMQMALRRSKRMFEKWRCLPRSAGKIITQEGSGKKRDRETYRGASIRFVQSCSLPFTTEFPMGEDHVSHKNINDTCALWNTSDDNPRSYSSSLSEWIIRVRRWERKMAEVMATISRSLHENGLETCQPSPSACDFTCCNGAIGKRAHPYARQRISDLHATHFRALLRIRRNKSRAIILSFATRKIQI